MSKSLNNRVIVVGVQRSLRCSNSPYPRAPSTSSARRSRRTGPRRRRTSACTSQAADAPATATGWGSTRKSGKGTSSSRRMGSSSSSTKTARSSSMVPAWTTWRVSRAADSSSTTRTLGPPAAADRASPRKARPRRTRRRDITHTRTPTDSHVGFGRSEDSAKPTGKLSLHVDHRVQISEDLLGIVLCVGPAVQLGRWGEEPIVHGLVDDLLTGLGPYDRGLEQLLLSHVTDADVAEANAEVVALKAVRVYESRDIVLGHLLLHAPRGRELEILVHEPHLPNLARVESEQAR